MMYVGEFGLIIWFAENVSDSCTKRPASRDHKIVSHAGRCHPSSYDNSSLSTKTWLPNSHLSVYPSLVCTILRSKLYRSFEGLDVQTAIKGSLLSDKDIAGCAYLHLNHDHGDKYRWAL